MLKFGLRKMKPRFIKELACVNTSIAEDKQNGTAIARFKSIRLFCDISFNLKSVVCKTLPQSLDRNRKIVQHTSQT